MRIKDKDEPIEVLWVKTAVYSLSLLLLLIFVIFAPKEIFNSQKSNTLAVSMALTGDDSLILYDYKVYSNETRFASGLIDDVAEEKQAFLTRNEVLAVKIYGETNKIEIREDLIFITSPETPELNIEYYLVQYMEVANINVPCRTFILLFEDVSRLINNIYIAIIAIISMSIFIPTSIKLTRTVVTLINKKNAQKTQ